MNIPKTSIYQLILRYANTSDVVEAPLVTRLIRSGDSTQLTYRFFIEGCEMLWCYSLAVGLDDINEVVEHELVAGQWDITVTMDVTNLKLVRE